MKLITTDQYLLLIDEEGIIEVGNHYLNFVEKIRLCKNKNEEHNVSTSGLNYDNRCKKIAAYYPLTKEAKELDLPLLPNPFEVNIEDLSAVKGKNKGYDRQLYLYKEGFSDGYKAAQSKQFSLEDMFSFARHCCDEHVLDDSDKDNIKWVSAFSKRPSLTNQQMFDNWQSLSTQQLPKEFLPIYQYKNEKGVIIDTNWFENEDCTLKTITNSEGKQVIQGTYKY